MTSQPDTAPAATHGELGQLGRTLQALAMHESVDQTLQRAVDLATELVRGCDVADIMFVRGRSLSTPVASHPVAVALDEAQAEADEGPCLSAADGGERVFVSNRLLADPRWPTFAKRAEALGIRSTVSYSLLTPTTGNAEFGALNLYGHGESAFDDEAIDLGELLAVHCSMVLSAAIEQEGLRQALASRDVIGQAKGILMERHRVPADEAFRLLNERAQTLNRSLRDVAEQVALEGILP